MTKETNPGYLPEEIAVYATEAQELLVVNYYTGSLGGRSVEETEKRIEDLGELVTPGVLTPTAFDPLLNMPNRYHAILYGSFLL